MGDWTECGTGEGWQRGLLEKAAELSDGRPVWRFTRKPDVAWMTNIEAGWFLVEKPGPSIFHTDGRMMPWSVWNEDATAHGGILEDWAMELFEIDAEDQLAELVEDAGGRLP